MPCDICAHTIQNVGAEDQRIFWCPRCGSLTTENGEHRKVESTILTRRVRDAKDRTKPTIDLRSLIVPAYFWNNILEAVGRLIPSMILIFLMCSFTQADTVEVTANISIQP